MDSKESVRSFETNIMDYKFKAIMYSQFECQFAKSVKAIDEGSFYRIDNTHIVDKHKIQSIKKIGNKLSIVMKDKTIVLEVEE